MLRERRRRMSTASANRTNPIAATLLVVDDRHPYEIIVDGITIALQDKQYRLIRVLATSPGECVPHDTVYDAVWGDTVVENNQMHFQKRKLLERIETVTSRHKELVKTIPRHGFVLELPDEQVRLIRRAEWDHATHLSRLIIGFLGVSIELLGALKIRIEHEPTLFLTDEFWRRLGIARKETYRR